MVRPLALPPLALPRFVLIAAFASGLVSLLLAWAAAPVGVRAGDPCFHSTDRPPVTDEAATHVRIGECAFVPTIARVPVGSTVTFTNGSVMDHEVAGANLTWGAAQTPIAPARSVEHTFAAAGVYPYSCMIHPGMTGAIVVGDGGVAAVGAVTPPAVDATPEANAATTGSAAASTDAVAAEPLPIAVGLALAGLVGASLVGALVGALVVASRHRRETAAG
jgi:plastocyanin